MLVVDNASKVKNQSDNPKVFMWAALLHDIGKVPATKIRKGKITAYNHDTFGEDLTKEFLSQFTSNDNFIYLVSKIVRWHMQTLYVINNWPYANIKKMLSETNLNDIALLSFCDRLGRGEMKKEDIQREEKNIKDFVNKCLEFGSQ
jgi:hypothetical protein